MVAGFLTAVAPLRANRYNTCMKSMTEGRPAVLILKFSMPLLAGNLLQQMYNLVDSVVVGQFVGKEALAAVGSTNILNFLLISLFSGLALGFTILISQFFGAKEKDKIKRAVDTAYVVACIGAAAVTVLGLLLTEPLLSLMNTPAGPTHEMSGTYLRILFIGTIGTFGYNLNAGILQGLGDSMSSLRFLAVATVINIVLDLVFVVVFGWGVAGVAWATVIAQAVSFLLGGLFIVRKLKLSTLDPRDLEVDPRIFSEAARIGLPGGVQNMLFSLGTMAIQRLVNSYGPVYMAGFSISGRIDSVAFLPIASFASAATTFTGQNIGANKLDRVRRGHRSVQLMSALVCVVISLVVLLNARFLMSLFSPEEEVILAGTEVLYRLMPCYVLLSFLFLTNSVLRGAGESIVPFIASMTSFLFLRMPAAYLLDHFFGRSEIGWCYGIGWVFGIAIAVPYYLSGRWKKRLKTENLQKNLQ
ncbi:MAG: Multidrug export protein MepA [Spirochaetes bacterium ADurb.Bin269]|nr:MAG: Multidrug export protein MepA [Spirochaetes bacterium ADurb.Bin269]